MKRRSSWLLGLVLLAGCGDPNGLPPSVAARGTLLTKGGAPLQVAGREIGTGMVSVIFIPVPKPAEGGQTYSTTVDDKGEFDLPGGIPAGKYRVAVRQWEPYPTTDKLDGKYDEEKSPLEVEVAAGKAIQLQVD